MLTPASRAWIEPVAQSVTEHIDGEHGEGEADSGEEDVVRIDAERPRPSAMMLPQVGVSGGMPMPRKERIASIGSHWRI